MKKNSTLYYNARFYSLAGSIPAFPRNPGRQISCRREAKPHFWEAIRIKNGKIIETIEKYNGAEAGDKIDLHGAAVFPGFIDTHTHSFEGGFYLLAADLSSSRSLDEVFGRLQNTAPISGKVYGYKFDEGTCAEKRFPLREELDRLFPRTPLIVRRIDGHSCVINTAAAGQISWSQSPPDELRLRGLLNRDAVRWFHDTIDDDAVYAAYRAAAFYGLTQGLTGIHTMIGNGSDDLLHFSLLQDKLSSMPLRYSLYPQVTDVDLASETGAGRIGGCILADGSIGSRTAALFAPYADESDNYGILYHDDAFWEDLIRRSHKRGLQVAVHALGDRAVDQIARIFERVQNESPRDLRHQIIHNELARDESLDAAAAAGCCSVSQPFFDHLWGGSRGAYAAALGPERALACNRFASMLARGISVCGGSDWYITDLKPLAGIDAACSMHNSSERLSLFQALRLYTVNAAALSFDEDRFGSIETGKEADLVCLAHDPFDSAAESPGSYGSISSIPVLWTMVAGKIYKNEEVEDPH
jgi:hypothetical protein